ncbi:MAG: 30S ribosomal protein S4 [Thermoplasmata archaeon]
MYSVERLWERINKDSDLMGDPKFSRKKYQNPPHPWQADRIKVENDYMRHYGLKNKKEFWKAKSNLKRIRGQARHLQARLRYGDKQATKEIDELLSMLHQKGYLVGENIGINDVLNLEVENILNRRLQTVVFNRGLARSPNQARQFITHGHIRIKDRRVNIPSYTVNREDEAALEYHDNSPLKDELHPERPGDEAVAMTIEERMQKEEERKKFNRRRRR